MEPFTFTITVLGFKKLTGWAAIKFLMYLYMKKIMAAMAATGISAHNVTTTSLGTLFRARFIERKSKSDMIKIAIKEGMSAVAAEFIVNFIINIRLS
jgi:hypothetical protein